MTRYRLTLGAAVVLVAVVVGATLHRGLQQPAGAGCESVVTDAQPAANNADSMRSANRRTAADYRPLALVDEAVEPCQALGPTAPCPVHAVDCSCGACCNDGDWRAARVIPWQAFAQGEYVGHERTAHVPQYRLRVDDLLEFRYRLTRDETATPYELNVGDTLKVESFTDEKLSREVVVQPDGTITMPLLGRVQATRRTAPRLRDELEEAYKEFVKVPAITVTPLRINTKLEDLRSVVDSRYGTAGGQTITARVTPDGTIALPAIGSSVPAQGLSLDELKREIGERYVKVAGIEGIEVTPALLERAPRFVYVLGQVNLPGRYRLEGPTTVMQAIAMAGSWQVGGNLRQVVVFRRGDDWRLLATKLDLWDALYGRKPCPAGEIWVNDSDIVVVPKQKILEADEWIELIFTRGIYGVIPMQSISINFSKLSTI
ncbi:MAG: sugar ABC transporter substrate-binding protein [Planctomycetota bacterium]|nr:MAG: sugar ABC transporter substrate-binding protein [Planctomycetota bacterium]